MLSNKLPVCFFPTKTLLIDDNLNFLQNLAFELGNDITHFGLFSRPQEALDFFATQYHEHTFLQSCIQGQKNDTNNNQALEINIDKIHQEVFNPNRFEQVTTV